MLLALGVSLCSLHLPQAAVARSCRRKDPSAFFHSGHYIDHRPLQKSHVRTKQKGSSPFCAPVAGVLRCKTHGLAESLRAISFPYRKGPLAGLSSRRKWNFRGQGSAPDCDGGVKGMLPCPLLLVLFFRAKKRTPFLFFKRENMIIKKSKKRSPFSGGSEGYSSTMVTVFIFCSFLGLSARSVCTMAIASSTSKPSVSLPNAAY